LYKKEKAKSGESFRKISVVLFWIAVWTGISLIVDNPVLAATPLETAEAFIRLLKEGSFYGTVGRSLLRIGVGFASGFGAAVLLSALSRRYMVFWQLLSPMMEAAKSVPVASFAVVVLIWWGSSFLAVAVCFLVVLPNIYISTLEGLRSTDEKLLEMAQVFRLPARSRFFFIYRPALKPFLYSSLRVSLGMCWKSGVAAELIGIPAHSIGEQLYLSKIYLDTAGVFAWTAVVMLLAFLFEKGILLLTDLFFSWEPSCRGQRPRKEKREGGKDRGRFLLTEVTKGFEGKQVLDKINVAYEPGGIYHLTEPSGSGKTTLLHILAGLTAPDSGKVKTTAVCSMVFQEDRLCEDYCAVKNVELVMGDAGRAKEALGLLLERDALHKPCSQLSGGMKRRVALVRAMEADSDCVLLDEPFTGMDAATRGMAERYIRERRNGRTLIIASHI